MGTSPELERQWAELKRVQAALPGATKGNWRDVKTCFEFAGIGPPKEEKPM